MTHLVIGTRDDTTGRVSVAVSKPLHRLTGEWIARELRDLETERPGREVVLQVR